MSDKLRYFEYHHLPIPLQDISKPFHDLAQLFCSAPRMIVDHAEHEAGLRKLIEAKDCFVRSRLPK